MYVDEVTPSGNTSVGSSSVNLVRELVLIQLGFNAIKYYQASEAETLILCQRRQY